MISEIKRKQIIELRKEGKSQLDISKILKISLATVSLWCLKFDPDGEFNHIKWISKEDKDKIKEFYLNNNENLNKTCDNFPISKRTIRNILIGLGIYKYRKTNPKHKSINVNNWKRDKKRKLVEYKGGKCENCGYNKCIAALEFHHKDPSQKDFAISTNSYSYERMKLEVDKCNLLCSNCHKEEHEKLKKIALEA